ncbi:MAG TPA: iron ABC transporter permease [Tepidisphaeraceae bacterium]|jgi:iron complex transport system permease protein|nr:iron ABC transporter permease [Tepidisphaeraceae bacterium]
MTRWSAGRMAAVLIGSLLLWAVVAAACVAVGSTGEIAWPGSGFARAYRIEVVLVASLVGAGLGAAGVVYQAILRNPLADPYLLGVSSGASLLSLLWYVGSLESFSTTLAGAAGQQSFAFAGALASVAIVLAVSSRRGRIEPVTLILVGVIVNAVNGSIYLLIYFRHPEIVSRGGGPFTFLVGGIQTTLTRQQEWLAACCVGAGWLVLAYIAGQLNVASLSEAEAEALGVRIQRLRWIGLGVASIVTAAVVAISGPIGFVGLVSPHVARLIVGYDQRKLLPLATALAAALLAAADAVSRYLTHESLLHTQLPVGVLTGLLGGPFFLLLLWRSRHRYSGAS